MTSPNGAGLVTLGQRPPLRLAIPDLGGKEVVLRPLTGLNVELYQAYLDQQDRVRKLLDSNGGPEPDAPPLNLRLPWELAQQFLPELTPEEVFSLRPETVGEVITWATRSATEVEEYLGKRGPGSAPAPAPALSPSGTPSPTSSDVLPGQPEPTSGKLRKRRGTAP